MGANQVWDRHAINAEIRRRGMTLTGIAEDAGLNSSSCRQGVIGANRKGAEAIAKALNIPFRTLFPDSYTRGRHDERKHTHNDSANGSAKTSTELDSAAVAT
ncbi:MAG: helix-turn-helix domain-containing protein [Pseudomonadota bacterium]